MPEHSLIEQLVRRFGEQHPQQLAQALEATDPASAGELLLELPGAVHAEVLRFLQPGYTAELLSTLRPEDAAHLLGSARRDVAALALRRLDAEAREVVLSRLSAPASGELERLLSYPAGSVGMFMDPHVFTVPAELTVEEAIARVRAQPEHALYYVYVTGEDQRLVGVVNLRELLRSSPSDLVIDIARTEVEVVHAQAPLESVLSHSARSRVHALPVVVDHQLVGVIRYEALRALERRGRSGGDRSPKTGAALAELYAIGLRGLVSGGVSIWSSDEEKTR